MLKVSGLTKSFASGEGKTRVIDGVSFSVPEGECYALLGPSGCGKTTTLRCVAGLEVPDTGRIEIAGDVVCDPAAGILVPTHRRPIGVVFQSYAIWPHFDVFENVAYPLRVMRPRLAKGEIEARVMDVLKLVGMDPLARRSASRLSGGQQQRVALARAIVRKPALLLLDEPLSNLDARLRDHMRKELADLIGRIGVTALFVTHDQAEALSLASRVGVMSQGRILQDGTPRAIYRAPADPFVAEFLGAANMLNGRIEARREEGSADVLLDDTPQRLELETGLDVGTQVKVLLRPERLTLSAMPITDMANVLKGTVVSASFQGGALEYGVDLANGVRLRVIAPCDVDLPPGSPVFVGVKDDKGMVFRRQASLHGTAAATA